MIRNFPSQQVCLLSLLSTVDMFFPPLKDVGTRRRPAEMACCMSKRHNWFAERQDKIWEIFTNQPTLGVDADFHASFVCGNYHRLLLCGDCCHNDMVMVPKVPGVFQYRPSSDDAIPFLRPCTKWMTRNPCWEAMGWRWIWRNLTFTGRLFFSNTHVHKWLINNP